MARRRLAQELASLLEQATAALRRVRRLLPQPAIEMLKSHCRRLEGLVQKYSGKVGSMPMLPGMRYPRIRRSLA